MVRHESFVTSSGGEVTKLFVSRNFLESDAKDGDSPVGENEQPS